MTVYAVKVSIEEVHGDDQGLHVAMINELDTRRGGEKRLYNKNLLQGETKEMHFVISESNKFIDLRLFVGSDEITPET